MKLTENNLFSFYIDNSGTKLQFINIGKDDGDEFCLDFRVTSEYIERLYNNRGVRYGFNNIYTLKRQITEKNDPEYFI